MPSFLSLDLGSSKIKGLICDEKGQVIAIKEKEIMPSYQGDRVEYDAEFILSCSFEVIDGLFEDFNGDIDAFCIASQRSTFLFCDKNANPLSSVLSWQDGRGGQILSSVNISQTRVNEITGLYKTPYYSASKASWLLRNKIESKKTPLFMPLPSYIVFHLSGKKKFCCDPTIAQRTLLFDAKKGKWSSELCEAFGVKDVMLPEIVPTFLKDPIELYRKGRRLPLRCFCADQQAAALPFLDENTALVNFGTGAFVLSYCGEKFLTVPGILTSVAFSLNSKKSYMLEGTVNSCGTFFKWLELKMGITPYFLGLENIREDVLVLPAIGGIGSPYWDYDTKTAFYGFTSETGANALSKGCIEGIVFLLNESIELMRKVLPFSVIAVSGGLSEIDYFSSFLSDITGFKVFKTKATEATALGLAYFAASSMGFDCSTWQLLAKEKEFYPSISPEIAQTKKMKWKNFFNSVRQAGKTISSSLDVL